MQWNRHAISAQRIIIGSLMVVSIGILGAVVGAEPALAVTSTPTVNAVYPGASIDVNSPPSAIVAANKSEVVELTNTGFEIIGRNGNAISHSINSLWGDAKGSLYFSDPQVMWDPTTNRFYISMLENASTMGVDDGLAWGFSKTANPKSAKDFCTYFDAFNYGATSFPDLESLGDTTNFLMIASNRYDVSNEDIEGSDVAWISKPPSGNTCPASGSFTTGIQHLTNPDGSWAYKPTPARQVDSSTTGWITATTSYASADTLTMFKATESGDNLVIEAPQLLSVPEYTYPQAAPQAGTTKSGGPAPPLETSIFLSQVIEAYDPRLGHLDLWAAQTVAGGAGSVARWYEINAAAPALDQEGTVSSPDLWVFNASISPDRVVVGKKSAYGSSAIIEFSTSSSTAYPAIQMVSTIDGQPTSPFVLIKQSAGPYVDFACFEPSTPYCRWGDYSGAAPDPGSPLGQSYGNVWLSNQWNLPDINDSTPTWQTLVWNGSP
jgi:hypothetical protein